jgi:hypothetical protein
VITGLINISLHNLTDGGNSNAKYFTSFSFKSYDGDFNRDFPTDLVVASHSKVSRHLSDGGILSIKLEMFRDHEFDGRDYHPTSLKESISFATPSTRSM